MVSYIPGYYVRVIFKFTVICDVDDSWYVCDSDSCSRHAIGCLRLRLNFVIGENTVLM